MYKNFTKRYFSQLFFIFLFFYFFKKTSFGISEKLPVNLFFRMDILMTVFTTLSTLYFSILLLPSLFILFMLILFGNFFCYWLCPVGGIIDITNILLLRKKWKIRIKNPIFLHKIKILIFSGILLTALISNFVKIPFLFWIFDPFVIITRSLVFKKMLLVFLLIIFISILIPRFWCNNICPLGYLNYLIGVKLRNKIKKLKR